MTSKEAIRGFLRGSLDRSALQQGFAASGPSRRDEQTMRRVLDLDESLRTAFSSLPETRDSASRLRSRLAQAPAVPPGEKVACQAEEVELDLAVSLTEMETPPGAPERLAHLIRNWEVPDVRAAAKDIEPNLWEDENESSY
jgi:hypothetical protein